MTPHLLAAMAVAAQTILKVNGVVVEAAGVSRVCSDVRNDMNAIK